MPQEVIDQVNELGKANAQPELLTFYDRKGRLIGETENPGVSESIDNMIPPDDGLADLNTPTVNQDYGLPEEQDINSLQPNDIDHEPEVHYDNLDDIDPLQNPQEHLKPDQPQPPEPIEPEVLDQGASTPPDRPQRTRTQPQRLIPSFGGKKYASTAGVTTHLIHHEAHIDPNYTLVAHIVMVQYSMKSGMKQFKQRGEDAVSKELSQLHFRDTFKPINPKDLTNEERKEVLESHLFLKEKRDTTVQSRMAAGGNKQRGTIEKLEASSPTAALESVLLTAIIDAHEGRDVAVIDIPNAFVQTRLEDDADKAIMRLHGKLAELMVKVAPEIYTKYVIIKQLQKRDCFVCPPAQCSLWHHESRSPILPTFCH
jgi:hypothetical protein